jgi:DNA-binding transcriptional LysR family regulator
MPSEIAAAANCVCSSYTPERGPAGSTRQERRGHQSALSYVGKREPELVCVLPEREQPYPVFFVYHQERRRDSALGAVADAIAAQFRGKPA